MFLSLTVLLVSFVEGSSALTVLLVRAVCAYSSDGCAAMVTGQQFATASLRHTRETGETPGNRSCGALLQLDLLRRRAAPRPLFPSGPSTVGLQ